jgi:hypothetical protein
MKQSFNEMWNDLLPSCSCHREKLPASFGQEAVIETGETLLGERHLIISSTRCNTRVSQKIDEADFLGPILQDPRA